jgi:hypothetical protein
MHSLSKTIVSPDAAQAIIADTFGSANRIRSFEELKDGYFNAAYAITLADGQRCSLRRNSSSDAFCTTSTST